ncbi:MAG: hypothetical protein OEU74_04420 [Gammaproteobacteria bacterium]|nr:hypothetical protein [Gammaproteobacteria bacterium]
MAASLSLQAQPWEFAEPVAITATSGKGIFHHLESSGRRNIAVSAGTVAVAWEDDRDGTPRIYLARKARQAGGFSAEVKISGNGEAYEPSLVALDQNLFALAWEEDARIHARLVSPAGPGPVVIVADTNATQASLAIHGQQLLLIYSQAEGRYGRIWFQRLAVDGQTLRPQQRCPVDAETVKDDQLYPVAVSLGDRTLVAWEDRRPGHTIIMAAQNSKQAPCRFTAPQRISERPPGPRMPYGKGHGVARVALDSYGANRALAAWADKRDFREGYDIYAADYEGGDERLFGPNIKVQDTFGGFAQQWHTTVAGHPAGRLVVAWDDNRDGNADIVLSWREDDGWSDDLAVPGAAGPGEQNHPTISLDREGNLHLAWIERATVGGPTRLRYMFGRALKD